MIKIKKISDFNLNSKKVLVRLDLNVPFKNKKIMDETRIVSAIPTIKEILKKKKVYQLLLVILVDQKEKEMII